MKKITENVLVGLTPKLLKEIDQLADETYFKRNKIIRDCIELALPSLFDEYEAGRYRYVKD